MSNVLYPLSQKWIRLLCCLRSAQRCFTPHSDLHPRFSPLLPFKAKQMLYTSLIVVSLLARTVFLVDTRLIRCGMESIPTIRQTRLCMPFALHSLRRNTMRYFLYGLDRRNGMPSTKAKKITTRISPTITPIKISFMP